MKKDTEPTIPQLTAQPVTGLSDDEQRVLTTLAKVLRQPTAERAELETSITDVEKQAVAEFRRIKAELKTNFEK